MTPRNLSILVVLGIVALAGGWYFGAATRPAQKVAIDGGRLAFPDLAPKLRQVARIEIASQGKTTTIAVKDGRGALTDRGGYPVIDTKLRGMLTALTELRLMEPRTSDPDQLRRLGVEDPAAKDSKSTLLRLVDASDKPILTLITGHRRVRTQAKVAEQIYVRFPGDNQAWLAEGALQVDSDPQLWLDRDVMNIDAKRIAGVTVTRGGEVLGFTRKDDKLALTQPADAPPLDEYRVDDVARALEYLNFQDVQPNSAPVGEALGQGAFVTSDGLRITASVFKAEKDISVRFAVTGDDAAKAEAEKLAAKVSGWTYQLGAWKEKALTPTLADLRKAEEKPADAPPTVPADAPAVSGTTTLPSTAPRRRRPRHLPTSRPRAGHLPPERPPLKRQRPEPPARRRPPPRPPPPRRPRRRNLRTPPLATPQSPRAPSHE